MDKFISDFETLTKDAETVQKETLKRILEENSSAEYLQNLGLNGRTDPESFKACVPIVTHKELEPYIYRIIGDSSPILTGKSITTMSLRSAFTVLPLFFLHLSPYSSTTSLNKFIYIVAVLELLRGSQNMFHGMMICLKPQCRYIKHLLPLETGHQFHLFSCSFL